MARPARFVGRTIPNSVADHRVGVLGRADLDALFLGNASDDFSMIGRSSFQSGAIQSETTFHFLPSHCWKVT